MFEEYLGVTEEYCEVVDSVQQNNSGWMNTDRRIVLRITCPELATSALCLGLELGRMGMVLKCSNSAFMYEGKIVFLKFEWD